MFVGDGVAASFVGRSSFGFASEDDASCTAALDAAADGAGGGEDLGGISGEADGAPAEADGAPADADGAPADADGGPNCGAVGFDGVVELDPACGAGLDSLVIVVAGGFVLDTGADGACGAATGIGPIVCALADELGGCTVGDCVLGAGAFDDGALD